MTIVGVSPEGDRIVSNARLSARASHKASPASSPWSNSAIVAVSSPLARQASATSRARDASVVECDTKTSFVLFATDMMRSNAVCQFAHVLVKVIKAESHPEPFTVEDLG